MNLASISMKCQHGSGRVSTRANSLLPKSALPLCENIISPL